MIETYNFSAFEESKHMLEWLHPNPMDAIKQAISDNLTEQVPGSELLGLHVTSNPEWLTGALPTENDETKAILVRVGVAFSFALSVKTPEGEIHDLEGVYTWVSVNMNEPDKIAQRTWWDLNGSIEEFGANGYLQERMRFDENQ